MGRERPHRRMAQKDRLVIFSAHFRRFFCFSEKNLTYIYQFCSLRVETPHRGVSLGRNTMFPVSPFADRKNRNVGETKVFESGSVAAIFCGFIGEPRAAVYRIYSNHQIDSVPPPEWLDDKVLEVADECGRDKPELSIEIVFGQLKISFGGDQSIKRIRHTIVKTIVWWQENKESAR
jgi:hypothetical protein